MPNKNVFSIIYTSDAMYLSRQNYAGWRDMQDQFEGFKASLGEWYFDEILEFLEFEYPKNLLKPPQTWRGLLEELDTATHIECVRIECDKN